MRSPTNGMPSPFSTRGRGCFRDASMFRMMRSADFFPMRSSSISCSAVRSVKIGDTAHDPLFDELIHQRLAHAVDIHDRTGGRNAESIPSVAPDNSC